MVGEDVRIRQRDTGMFVRSSEKLLGVAHPVLVHRIIERHQDARRRRLATSGTPPLLPGAGDSAGIPVQDRHIQPADIDAKFQRVGRYHAP